MAEKAEDIKSLRLIQSFKGSLESVTQELRDTFYKDKEDGER